MENFAQHDFSKTVEKKFYYSEIFYSIQGEGHYTGVPTAWIRFFLCNLQCNGFGQIDPTNPETYDLPFENFDVSSVKKVEDLPVWDKGCDSSYTWAKKFKQLMGQEQFDEKLAQNEELAQLRADTSLQKQAMSQDAKLINDMIKQEDVKILKGPRR